MALNAGECYGILHQTRVAGYILAGLGFRD